MGFLLGVPVKCLSFSDKFEAVLGNTCRCEGDRCTAPQLLFDRSISIVQRQVVPFIGISAKVVKLLGIITIVVSVRRTAPATF
jgi:hypothetical protein